MGYSVNMMGYYGGIWWDTEGYSVNMMGYYGGIPARVSGDHRGDTCTPPPHLLFPRALQCRTWTTLEDYGVASDL